MRQPTLQPFGAALLAALLALAACDSPEERAEAHFRRGLELLAEGDGTGARIEFRNALQQDRGHTAARLEFARGLAAAGNVPEAIGQYLRVVEQDDANGRAHLELAQLAIRATDYGTASKHARRAFQLMPDDPRARAQMATVEFREGDRDTAVAMAEGVLAEVPDSIPARFVLIADRMADGDFRGALAGADAALALAPDSRDLHLARLSALEELGDGSGVGLQLRRMVDLFASNAEFSRALAQWHLGEDDAPAALAVMRRLAERDPGDPAGYLDVARFRLDTEGPGAARAELQRLIAARSEPGPFVRALAELDFAEGRHAEAIAALEAVVGGKESTPEIRDLQVALAGMLLRTGRAEDAGALVDAVLGADDRHVEALKLRAWRFIDADQPERALQDLDVALTDSPRDPEVMTIMAAAHEREGAHDLAGQRLARAVEAADFAPAESLRYARFLLADGRVGPAESTVLDALRRAPRDLDLLTSLGEMHVRRGDWTRAREVVEDLRRLEGPDASHTADVLEVRILQAEGRPADMVAMLERRVAEGQADPEAMLGLARARLTAGDAETARAEVAKVLAEDPADEAGRLLLAQIHALEGETRAAEQLYRKLIAASPGSWLAYDGLFAVLAGIGRADEARAALDAGIAATGRDGTLLSTKVGLLVADGDFAGAIALLEELYARDTSNVVVANNLASLISTHRDDAESVERAFRIARRFRGSDNPYFQDTYGWILTRRGDGLQALAYLEPAAAALADDPLAQFRLGMTYLSLERPAAARMALARAIEIAGPDSPLPQIRTARQRIAEIDAAPPRASGG